VDISRHVARRLEPRDVQEADVVIGMAAEHRDAVVRLVPEAAAKTFTLKELVRLLEALPSTAGPSFGERVTRADELRRSGFAGNPADEDVADPMGASLDVFRAVAWELDEWCRRLSPGLIPSASKQEAS
jgi:protein-tyrosine phosphatase